MMQFFATVFTPFFVGAFVSFAAMRLREENQRAQHRAELEASASTSVTEAQYVLAMQEFLAAQDDEDRGGQMLLDKLKSSAWMLAAIAAVALLAGQTVRLHNAQGAYQRLHNAQGAYQRLQTKAAAADAARTAALLQDTGLILPGKFVRYTDGAVQRTGIVRASSVNWSRPTLRQTLQLETHGSD